LFEYFCDQEELLLYTSIHPTVIMKYELGEPFFEEKGKITSQKEIGGNRTEAAYSANGTVKSDIEVTNTGSFVGISKGNNVTTAEGQGVITTNDGSGEKANYTFLAVGSVNEEGKPIFRGSAVWSTDSTGKLAFLDCMLSFFKVELDEMGNFVSKERELK
jgi:hypothetical protein